MERGKRLGWSDDNRLVLTNSSGTNPLNQASHRELFQEKERGKREKKMSEEEKVGGRKRGRDRKRFFHGHKI